MAFYFDVIYEFDYLTLTIPFLLSLAIFYATYWVLYMSYSHRVRSKRLVQR